MSILRTGGWDAHWGMGYDQTGPTEVAGKGIFPIDGLWDAAVDYDFQCKYADGLTMRVASNNHITQGVRFIGEEGVASNNHITQGVRFIGEEGWVHITRGGLKTEPTSLVREKIGPDEIHLSKPSGDHRQGHRRDFLDCVKTRSATISPVEVGHRSAIPCHLGNIAMILGRKIHWDPKREQILGDATANRTLSRAMRSPWHL